MSECVFPQNQNNIDWWHLSTNNKAMHLLEKNVDKIYWKTFSSNHSIFEIDYKFLKNRIQPFKEELMQKVFHPDRLVYCLEKYNYDIANEKYM